MKFKDLAERAWARAIAVDGFRPSAYAEMDGSGPVTLRLRKGEKDVDVMVDIPFDLSLGEISDRVTSSFREATTGHKMAGA